MPKMNRDIWPEIKRLQGKTLHTLGHNRPFTVVSAIVLHVHLEPPRINLRVAYPVYVTADFQYS